MSNRVKCFWSLAFSSRAIAVVWSMNSSGLVIALTGDPLELSARVTASREGPPFNPARAEKSSEVACSSDRGNELWAHRAPTVRSGELIEPRQ